MEEWTKPRVLASTSTLRGRAGVAIALAGRAAIILSTSAWHATRGLLLRPPHASCCGADGAGVFAAMTRPKPSLTCAAVSEPALAASHSPNQLSNAPLN